MMCLIPCFGLLSFFTISGFEWWWLLLFLKPYELVQKFAWLAFDLWLCGWLYEHTVIAMLLTLLFKLMMNHEDEHALFMNPRRAQKICMNMFGLWLFSGCMDILWLRAMMLVFRLMMILLEWWILDVVATNHKECLPRFLPKSCLDLLFVCCCMDPIASLPWCL